MKKILEILRMKWVLGRSNREIANSTHISSSTVSNYVRRAAEAGLDWQLAKSFTEEELTELLFSSGRNKTNSKNKEIDWSDVHNELKSKGVTLLLLWDGYKVEHPEGLSYSRYCSYYREWKSHLSVSMRQQHKLGEKVFVDYAGVTVPITVDKETGETVKAQIFVGTLGASNYIFAEATLTQSLPDWIGSHVRMFEFFGGLPEVVVPDNLKSGIKNPHRYDPEVNSSYAEMAEHYGVAVIPCRVRAPKDKAKAEQAVQHIERRILAKLRNRKFFRVEELNEVMRELLDEVNCAPFQKLPGSRLSQFEDLEKPTLKPLPTQPYELANWSRVTAGNDYHVEVEGHYYSVPHTLCRKKMWARYTELIVEMIYDNRRVASHRFSFEKGGCTTQKEHMPKAHLIYANRSYEQFKSQAEKIGDATVSMLEEIAKTAKHEQQGMKLCEGILSLGKSYGAKRLEAACHRAVAINSYSYKSVQSILKNNLDSMVFGEDIQDKTDQSHATEKRHEFIRGGNYFH